MTKFNLLALTPISTLRESAATCKRGTEAAAIRREEVGRVSNTMFRWDGLEWSEAAICCGHL